MWHLIRSLIVVLALCAPAAAASFTAAPAALTIAIPAGQTSGAGAIVTTNTGTTALTLTWTDAMSCLQGLTPLTRTLLPGASTTWTINGICPQTGTATLGGAGVATLTLPVSITKAATGVPGAPTLAVALAASVTNAALLTWDPSAAADLAGYHVYTSVVAGVYGLPVGTLGRATPTFTVSNLSSGLHYFVVTAFDNTGNESQHSNEVSKNIP